MKTKQIKPKAVSPRFELPHYESKLSFCGIKVFRSLDRKHAKPKIMYFPQEKRYAFPANLGNAVNPLVFGKIPKYYVELERKQNAKVLHTNGLNHTNMQRYQARLSAMNYHRTGV